MTGSSAAIRRTSEVLLRLLRLRLARNDDDSKLNQNQIRAVPPTAVEADSDVRLTIYLYNVSKAGALNTETSQFAGETKRKTPLGLELQYLLMAFPATNAENRTDGVFRQHQVLGEAMQTLYDAAAIDADELPDELGDEGLTVTLRQHEQGELTDLWSTFPELPLNPCATYDVKPVKIPSTQGTPFERVDERDLDVGRGVDDERDDDDDDEQDRLSMG